MELHPIKREFFSLNRRNKGFSIFISIDSQNVKEILHLVVFWKIISPPAPPPNFTVEHFDVNSEFMVEIHEILMTEVIFHFLPHSGEHFAH